MWPYSRSRISGQTAQSYANAVTVSSTVSPAGVNLTLSGRVTSQRLTYKCPGSRDVMCVIDSVVERVGSGHCVRLPRTQ